MEGLATVVADPLREQDKTFSPECICVQSRGMKHWISVQLAEKFGICANISYMFPRDIINIIVSASFLQKENDQADTGLLGVCHNNSFLLNPEESCFLNKDIILFKIMAVLPELLDRHEFKLIKNYLGDDKSGVRLYQISKKIAGNFDNYLVYRPEMLVKWEEAGNRSKNFQRNHGHGQTHDEDKANPFDIEEPDDFWQPVLWNEIAGESGHCRCTHIAKDALSFLSCDLANHDSGDLSGSLIGLLPARVSFFGISAIPPLFLKIFEKVADYIDINFFILFPSKEFFGYISSPKQTEKLNTGKYESISSYQYGVDDDFYFEQGNPLLASLGTSIRNFSLILEDLSYNEPYPDLWYDPAKFSDSMLACLQSDILNLVHRREKGSKNCFAGLDNPADSNHPDPVKISDKDRSVSIHSCHSPMREAQVLKDLLFDLFSNDPGLKPHDIIVMMPDIESYAPYIESVFSVEHKIPFTISDKKKRKQSEIVETFLEILLLADSRFTLTRVMDILARESVGRKFDFSEEDVVSVKEIAEKTGICWGMDAEHKKQLGFPEINENTWWFGFQRLMSGYAMPERCNSLFYDVLPFDSLEGSDAEILGRFIFFCDTLFKCLKGLAKHRSVGMWCDAFREIFFLMMDTGDDNNGDFEFILGCLDEIKRFAEHAGYDRDISFDVAISFLNAKFDATETSGAFFTGAMVFCNLMPMRSIPFKVVAVMGMNDSDFPGQTFSDSFDLIKKYPRAGDRILRDEAKYLFLEALLSARRNFIVTYTGMSIKDNSIIPPAGVISELIDTIRESFILPDPENLIISHPLQPFSEDCFKNKDSASVFSFSENYFNIAVNLRKRSNGCLGNSDPLSGESRKALIDVNRDFQTCGKSGLASDDTDDAETIRRNNFGIIPGYPVLSDNTFAFNDIVSFFRMPAEYFAKKRLGMEFYKFPEFSDDREPVELYGLDNYFTGQLLLEKIVKYNYVFKCTDVCGTDSDLFGICAQQGIKNHHESQNVQNFSYMKGKSNREKKFYSLLKASGRLPHGEKGKVEFDAIMAEAKSIADMILNVLPQSCMEPYPVYVDMNLGCNTKITGSIDNVFKIVMDDTISVVRYDYSFAKFSAKKILTAWIYHLVLNIYIEEKYPVNTYLFLRGDDPSKAVNFFFPSLKNAFSYFCDLVDLFKNGMERPLLFFPETSWVFAETIRKSRGGFSYENIKKAVGVCRKKWNGSFYMEGEKTNRYLSFVFKDNDPFDAPGNDKFYNVEKGTVFSDDELDNMRNICNALSVEPEFVFNAVKIFSPLIDNMEMH